MDVSVIIINYNTYELTSDCVRSILLNTKDITYEIIVVDNGSASFDSASFKEAFPQVKLIVSPVNLGFAKGNNLGLTLARGKFVLLLNSDVIIHDDAILTTHNYLSSAVKTAVATVRLVFPNGKIQHNCQRFPSAGYKTFELLRLQKILGHRVGGKILMGPFFNYHTIAHPDWVWGTFFMFRKDLINLLPEKKLADDFFMYGEDMQWCSDFKNLGFKVVFLPNGQVTHLMGASSGNKEMINRNLETFMNKNYSAAHRFIIKVLNLLLIGRYGY